MARPSKYSPEFRSDAIALWRASAGRRTFKDIAVDLNVNPETLRTWVRDADGSPALDSASQGMEGEPARLRAENARHAVVAGTAWHWVDPAAGATKAGLVLRPGGLLARAPAPARRGESRRRRL